MERLANRSSQRLIGAIIQEPNAMSNALGYAKFRSRSDHAVIRVYDEAGNLIETHEQVGAETSKSGEVSLVSHRTFPLK
jgi:hypothetical protein